MATRHHSTRATGSAYRRHCRFKNVVWATTTIVGLTHLAITGDPRHLGTIWLGCVMLTSNPGNLPAHPAADLKHALLRWLQQGARP